MKCLVSTLILFVALSIAAASAAAADDADELKIAAIEALISAPDDKAMPILSKVLAGNHSVEVKESALFILSQTDSSEAQTIILDFARTEGDLQEEAIRMIGISGDATSLSNLRSIYDTGNSDAREAVLEALMIAGDKQTVFDIALTAKGDDLEEAVETLAVMDAAEELRELRSRTGVSEALIEAYAISHDLDSLLEIATDNSDIEMQAEAIEAMGIIGGTTVDASLMEIYGNATSDEIREAALDGMLISGNDAGILELYRASQNDAEKKELLEYLVMMDSDSVWEVIDSALDGGL